MKQIFTSATFVVLLTVSCLTSFAQNQSRDDLRKEIAGKRAELAKLEEALLAPSDEDRAKYADFLHLPDTGLFRLLPRNNDNPVESKSALTLRGGGSFYSFAQRTNDYITSTALGLERDQLITMFAGANYGMLANLGDIPLENVTLDGNVAQVFAQHTPAPDEPHARIEQRRAMTGATIDGISYKSSLRLVLNSTYLLRSVNYSASDTLVVFKVVRIDSDDSAIIVWKLLKKYPTPYLARN